MERHLSGKKLVVGILAHVDAGKTTLAEAILYLGGQIRKLGRVDHGDAFLDNFALERERGITIFSKQAEVQWQNMEVTLLDTPGHVDFSAEMERTLQVLDYAVLVINGADGVQGHTRTLWKLLERYEIPTFLFVNKMDQTGTDGAGVLGELKSRLNANCVAFSETLYRKDGEGTGAIRQADTSTGGASGTDGHKVSGAGGYADTASGGFACHKRRVALRDREALWEDIATCEEGLMNAYLERGELTQEEIAEAVAERSIFPCYFGSALHVEGVDALLDGLCEFAPEPMYPEQFAARVFKISRDAAGARLTHLKVTGGELRVRMSVDNSGTAESEAELFCEKADQLRIYNGTGFETADVVPAGGVCAVTGLGKTFAGQGLGAESENGMPVLEPVLTYRLELPEGEDAVRVLGQLRRLEEEEPLLHILWQEENREIHAQVMGEVQIEVLKKMIAERFGLEINFGAGSIVYKETIAGPAIGIGHFEPLRHYAEVELLLEPGERGSGLQFASLCSEDVLDRNWQRLILTHLEEKVHVGVLTGSPVTDLRILLVTGRAHTKHTEGGDFRQATYRAVRQGLRSAENILLEPVFAFTLEVPAGDIGRAMSDVQRMHGSFESPVTEGDRSILTGRAPVACMRDYQREVAAYTHGNGHLSCVLDGYEPCHNAEEIIEEIGYDAEADLQNPTGSVFCSHGAGFVVEWDQVPEYAHVEIPAEVVRLVSGESDDGIYGGSEVEGLSSTERLYRALKERGDAGLAAVKGVSPALAERRDRGDAGERVISQEEIESIFRQTYGRPQQDHKRRRRYHISHREIHADGRKPGPGGAGAQTGTRAKNSAPKESCLLVDGYNIIFAWEELRELSQVNIDSARDRLIDIMSNYQGYAGGTLILVFDAYKVKGNPGSVTKHHNIYVVYTKEAETADAYIEKTVHEMADKYQVTVATSDRLEQMIIWGAGALRMSAAGLYEAVENASRTLREEYTERDSRIASRPFL